MMKLISVCSFCITAGTVVESDYYEIRGNSEFQLAAESNGAHASGMERQILGKATGSEKLDALMEIGTVVKELPDFDKMSSDLKSDTETKIIPGLEQKRDELKALRGEAKTKFRLDRKAIRDNFRLCRKSISKKNDKWKRESQCAPFVPYFTFAMIEGAQNELEAQEEEEVMIEGAQNKQGGETRQKKKAEKKATKAAERAAQCKKNPKCDLRSAKRRAKAAAKEELKTIRTSYRDAKKQLRQAKYQASVMPKVMKLLTPSLFKGLASANTSEQTSGQVQACEEIGTKTDGCLPLADTCSPDVAVNFFQVLLKAKIGAFFKPLHLKMEAAIWRVVDPLYKAAKNALVSVIGSIPFVGGFLGVALGIVFDQIYQVVKFEVNLILLNLVKAAKAFLFKMINGTVSPLFTSAAIENATQRAALSSEMKKTGDAAEEEVLSSTQNKITDGAADALDAAEEAAKSANAEITDEAEVVKEDEEDDNEEEDDEEEDEDAEDDAEDY